MKSQKKNKTTSKEVLTESKRRIYKRFIDLWLERKRLAKHEATMIELALMDDLVKACYARVNEIDELCKIGDSYE